MTLVRNDDYWGEKAKLDKLVFKIIPDESHPSPGAQGRQHPGLRPPNPVDWQGLKDDGNQVLVRPAFNILYLGLNPKKNPKLADLKVRQALYHALNREQLVKTQLPEGASVATQFIPDTVNGYNKDLQPVAYDKAKAKQLLKEAGAEGLELQFAYPTEVTRPYMPDPQKIFRRCAPTSRPSASRSRSSPSRGTVATSRASTTACSTCGCSAGPVTTTRGQLHRHLLRPEQRLPHRRPPWGKALSDKLKAADAIIDEDERAAVRAGQQAHHGGCTSRLCRSRTPRRLSSSARTSRGSSRPR